MTKVNFLNRVKLQYQTSQFQSPWPSNQKLTVNSKIHKKKLLNPGQSKRSTQQKCSIEEENTQKNQSNGLWPQNIFL